MTLYKTLKKESTNKNHYDDNYSAPFACRSFAFHFSNVPFFPPSPHETTATGKLLIHLISKIGAAKFSNGTLPRMAQVFIISDVQVMFACLVRDVPLRLEEARDGLRETCSKIKNSERIEQMYVCKVANREKRLKQLVILFGFVGKL